MNLLAKPSRGVLYMIKFLRLGEKYDRYPPPQKKRIGVGEKGRFKGGWKGERGFILEGGGAGKDIVCRLIYTPETKLNLT